MMGNAILSYGIIFLEISLSKYGIHIYSFLFRVVARFSN